jgi:hypothetical protein
LNPLGLKKVELVVKFRNAKIVDANQIANIHIESSKNQPGGFMHQLGYLFILNYYKILIQEKHSIVIIAEDENGLIYGFCSGTLDAREHIISLNKNRLLLFLSSLPSILKSPKLLIEIFNRKNHINNENNTIEFNNKIGARNEYWGWRNNCDKSKSPELFKTWMNIVFSYGYNSFNGEVDSVNKSIVLFHKILGAKILKEVKLPDGRTRYFVEYIKK